MQLQQWVSRKLFVGGFICLLAMAVGATVLAVNRHRTQSSKLQVLQASQVQNKTLALQVLSATLNTTVGDNAEGAIALTLRNARNDRKVTGFVIDNGGVVLQVDLLALDNTILPGGQYATVVPPKSPGGRLNASDISVLAAILENDSYDGDAKTGQWFLDRRQGQKRELELLVPILKNSLTLPDEDVITKVLGEIEKIPHPHILDLPKAIMSGSHEMRERIVGKIQDHQALGKKTKPEDMHFLGQIYQEYTRILSKL
jgi:hypothetical protein